MPTNTTAAPANAPAGIKLKSAVPPPTQAVPDLMPAEPAVPTLPPIDAALQRIQATRESNAKTSLTVYRAAALKLVDDVALEVPEVEAVAHALEVLGLTPDTLRADVAAIKQHRMQLGFAEAQQKIADELMPQSRDWGEELERLEARKREIAGLRGRLMSTGILASQYLSQAGRLASEHLRVLGTLEQAIADSLKSKTPTGSAASLPSCGWVKTD